MERLAGQFRLRFSEGLAVAGEAVLKGPARESQIGG